MLSKAKLVLKSLMVLAILLSCSRSAKAQNFFPCTQSSNVGFWIPPIGNSTVWGSCINQDLQMLDTYLGGFQTLTPTSSSPSISGYTNWQTANTVTTTITSFLGGFPGQTIRIICGPGDVFTQIVNSSLISIVTTFSCSSSTGITLTYLNGVWYEVGRGGGGGGGSPGGLNTAVQFNNSSAFGGDATNFFYNSTTHALTVSGPFTSNTSLNLLNFAGSGLDSITRSSSDEPLWNGGTWPGGSGTPGGSNTAVQFNNSGAFGGDVTNFFFNDTSHGLTITGPMVTATNSFALNQLVNPANIGDVICGTTGPVFADCVQGVAVNPLSGSSYSALTSADNLSLVLVTGTGTALTGPPLASNIAFSLLNRGSSLTFTPASGNVNGASTQVVPSNSYAQFFTDNTNTYGPVVPTLAAFPSCSGASNALTFSTSTFTFGCNTISGGGGAGAYVNGINCSDTSPGCSMGVLWDSNQFAAFSVGTTASAVNGVTLTDAATGGAPTLAATGSDTNIGLTLGGKGTGAVNLNGASSSNISLTTNGGINLNPASGQNTIISNAGSGVAQINLSTSASDKGLVIKQGASSPTGDILDLQTSTPTTEFSIGPAFTITKYNSTATAGNGIEAVDCAASQVSETGSATVLTCTPASAVGSYIIHLVISVSAATSATIGWTATWTDSNGNAQAPTNLALFQSGAAAPALTFTTSAAGNYYAEAPIDINNAGTNIVVKVTFSGTSVAEKVSAWIDRGQ